MSKLWVCATCSQDFTRKYSAQRHLRTLHGGKGDIVRTLDYIVGRMEGKYIRADPMSYRRKYRQKVQPNSSIVAKDHSTEINAKNNSNIATSHPNEDEELLPARQKHTLNVAYPPKNNNSRLRIEKSSSGQAPLITNFESRRGKSDMNGDRTALDQISLGDLVLEAIVKPMPQWIAWTNSGQKAAANEFESTNYT